MTHVKRGAQVAREEIQRKLDRLFRKAKSLSFYFRDMKVREYTIYILSIVVSSIVSIMKKRR